MLREISDLIGLRVYTPGGAFLGSVSNLVLDVERGKLDGLFLAETSPALVEAGRAVNVPYRWVQSVGDVIILRTFPKRVSLRKTPGQAAPVPLVP